MDRKTLLLVTLFVEGGLFFLGLLLMGGPGALLSTFSPSWSATGYALSFCIPMFVGLYFAVVSKWKPLSRLKNELDEKVIPIFANCKIIDLAVIAFLAGVSEELFFRGWLQGALISKIGVLAGIVGASVIFGFAHYLSLTYVVYAGLTGIYLGVIYQASGNLYVVMAIHALYDFVALVYLVRRMKEKGSEPQTTSNAG